MWCTSLFVSSRCMPVYLLLLLLLRSAAASAGLCRFFFFFLCRCGGVLVCLGCLVPSVVELALFRCSRPLPSRRCIRTRRRLLACYFASRLARVVVAVLLPVFVFFVPFLTWVFTLPPPLASLRLQDGYRLTKEMRTSAESRMLRDYLQAKFSALVRKEEAPSQALSRVETTAACTPAGTLLVRCKDESSIGGYTRVVVSCARVGVA